ncbi:MAG: hypothetical protein Q8P51_07115 [Ignavibacteria bacterium]|nr:hypothetical protein [Ignavibacteria bacterium]
MRKALLLFLIFFTGCTSSYQLVDPPSQMKSGKTVSFEELRDAVEGENAVITLKDSVVSGMIHEVRRDSIIFQQWRHARQSVQFSQVSRIRYTGRLQGMADWAGFGALAGSVVATSLWAQFPKANPVGVVLVGMLTGTIVGAPAGAIAGLIIGHIYEYQLSRDSATKEKQ